MGWAGWAGSGRVKSGQVGPSRAEPSRAEPSRAEPSRDEPRRAEPSRAETRRAETSRAEPSRNSQPGRSRRAVEPRAPGTDSGRTCRTYLINTRPNGASVNGRVSAGPGRAGPTSVLPPANTPGSIPRPTQSPRGTSRWSGFG